jgi:hypothetical protein
VVTDDVNEAFRCIVSVYPDTKGLERIFVYPIYGKFAAMIERLHMKVVCKGHSFGLSCNEVIDLLDNSCTQQTRETVRLLILALTAFRDGVLIAADVSAYEEMHARGVISDRALYRIKNGINPVSNIAINTKVLDNCSICFVEKDMYRLTQCGHMACEECICLVYQSSATCHICRGDISSREHANTYKNTPLSLSEF